MLALLIVILPVVDEDVSVIFSPLPFIVRFLELPVVEIVMSLEIVKKRSVLSLAAILAVEKCDPNANSDSALVMSMITIEVIVSFLSKFISVPIFNKLTSDSLSLPVMSQKL